MEPHTQRIGRRWAIFIGAMATAVIAVITLSVFTSTDAKAGWTGCGVGAHGSQTIGDVTAGGPIGLSSSGQTAGISVSCDMKLDRVVVGAFGEYDWMFGDLKSIGINNDLTLGARAGFLLTPTALLYGHAGWSRVDTDGGNVNGWKVGLGTELQIPDRPLYIDLRYSYGTYNVDSLIGTGVDAHTNAFRAGLVWKFNGPDDAKPMK